MSTPINYPDTPRNLIDKHLGQDALVLLDSLGIGVYWRAELRKRQKLMQDMSDQLIALSSYPCPFAQVARVTDRTLFIPFPTACRAHKHIIRRRFCGDIVSKTLAVHKQVPATTSVRSNRKHADIRLVGKTHRFPW